MTRNLFVILTLSAFLYGTFCHSEEPQNVSEPPVSSSYSKDSGNSGGKTKRLSYLGLERVARTKFPEVDKNLRLLSKYSKRLPAHWGEIDLSSRQTKEIYSLQEGYFDEIAKLEARIARLEKERDMRMRGVLSEKQRQKLDALIEEASQNKKKKSSKNSKEEKEK